MMRDARLNLIGEGANDVLRCFVSMVGFRGLGEELQGVMQKPWTATKLLRRSASVPVEVERLRYPAVTISKQIGTFVRACQAALIKHREGIMDQQLVQARLGDAATELYMMSCVYARMTRILQTSGVDEDTKHRQIKTGLLYVDIAARRNRARFNALKLNDDESINRVADIWLQHEFSNTYIPREGNRPSESPSV